MHPEGKSAPAAEGENWYFYCAGEGAVFNLEGIFILTTKIE